MNFLKKREGSKYELLENLSPPASRSSSFDHHHNGEFAALDQIDNIQYNPKYDSKKAKLSSTSNIAQYFATLTWRQITKRKVNFCLGFSAVFIVVVVVSVLMTVLSNAPVVFLKLAELQTGEIDMKMNALEKTLNFSLVNELVTRGDTSKHPDFTSSSPRCWGSIALYSIPNCDQKVKQIPSSSHATTIDWRYDGFGDERGEWADCKHWRNCFRTHCRSSRSSFLYIIDSDREKKMGTGRDWKLPELGPGEIYLTTSLAEELKVKKGDTIFLRTAPHAFFPVLWQDVYHSNRSLTFRGDIYMSLIVKDTFNSPKGKYATRWNRGSIMEFKHFLSYAATQLDPINSPLIVHKVKSSNLYDYVDQIIFNIPENLRKSYYIDSEYDSIQSKVASFASSLAYVVGFSSVDISLPLLPRLYNLRFVSIFLGLIVNVIIFVLLLICVILIYSLFVTNVETRTFEMGIFRMFGMRRFQVVFLLLCQAFSYSAFSIPFGLLAGQLTVVWLSSSLSSLIGFEMSKFLTPNAIYISMGMGFLIPLLSSILPIRAALSHSLSNSLLASNSKVAAVKISIDRSEFQTMSWSSLIIGMSLIAFGASIYYGLPLALVSLNLQLLLNIFVFLLLGMLLGMALFTLNFQTIMEKFLVHFLFFWEKRAIRAVVLKNLISHRERNQMTAGLYSIAVAFIVFVSVSYNLQLNSLLYQIQQENGALLKVTNNGWDPHSPQFRGITMVALMESWAASKSPEIENFAWISAPLNNYPEYSSVVASNIGHVFSDSVSVSAVSPNLFDVAMSGFLKIDEYDSSNNLDLLNSLYSAKGSSSTIMGTLYKSLLGLKLNSPFLLSLTNSTSGVADIKRMKSIGFLDNAPAFRFSKFPLIRGQDCLVSFPTFLRMAPKGSIDSIEDLPMKHFLFKLKSGLSDKQKDALKKELNSMVGGGDIEVFDYRDELEPIDTAQLIVGYFFNFTTVIAMLVCFFSLNSTMFNSIYSQTKEISILRAIGIQVNWMYRIYIYEALILVLSSSLFGMIIGSLIGYTMTIQRTLFTQLPIPFVFPTGILMVVVISSIVLSVAASWGPVKHLMRMSIVGLMRFMQ